MNRKKLLVGFVLSSLLMFLLMAGVCIAQGQAKTQNGPDKQTLETIKGTIDYNDRLGGYFIRGIEPGGEFFIVNQNAKVLKKLKKSGKAVIIEGRTGKGGAERFIIEKINGEKYSAPKTIKPTPKGN